jgi:mono/diheme cytochrome c family protein
MNRSISHGLVGITVLTLSLTGCNSERYPAYSANVKYGLRTDPIIRNVKELGDERHEPDRPGLMPIMKLDDILRPDHPYHANSKKIRDKVSAAPGSFILRDPNQMLPDLRKAMEDELDKLFGTPAKPKVDVKAAEADEKALTELKLDDKTLAEGSSYYRVHCLHCHGVPGNGRGPTARWVNPHPRDFRGGMFKFQSMDRGKDTSLAPSRGDLLRTLRQGIEGTAMPSFNLLPDPELEALASYVIHLSVRGEVEFKTIEALEVKDGNLVLAPGEKVDENVKFWTKKLLTERWQPANNPAKGIVVAPYPFDEKAPNYMAELKDSVKRGQQIFLGEPDDAIKEHFIKPHLKKAVDSGRAAEASRLAEEAKESLFKKREADALVSAKAKTAESKALADAETEASKKKEKLSDADKTRIKEAVQEDIRKELRDEIDKEVAKSADKFKVEAEKNAKKIEEEARKALLAKAQSVLSGAKCVQCHVDYGRQAKFKYDEWGTLVRPNNLTLGVYRGGKRPVDIYYRVHSGIPGSEMLPFANTFKDNERYLWDVVNFVTVLPYPNMRNQLGIKID